MLAMRAPSGEVRREGYERLEFKSSDDNCLKSFFASDIVRCRPLQSPQIPFDRAVSPRLTQLKLTALACAMGAVTLLNACDDPTGTSVPIENIDRKLTVYAMNSTPPTYPSAIQMRAGLVLRIDAGFNFDLAFDITSDNVIGVYTAGSLASELANPRRVGLQLTNELFSQAKTAPTSGYVYDSSYVVTAGQTMFVDVIEPACTGSFRGPNIRSKLVVDSFDLTSRAIHLHILVNRNCGFRSLVDSVPKD
jgi:hypothetical protein